MNMAWFSRMARHFRMRKTKGKDGKKKLHPNYIVGEDRKHFFSLGLTHETDKGKKHKNYKLSKNPKFGDNSPSYMRKHIETGNKHEYSTSKLKNYRMSAKDDNYVDSLIEKKRKYLDKNKKK